jgi:hypothetical protein
MNQESPGAGNLEEALETALVQTLGREAMRYAPR